MKETERLYFTDSDLLEFTATVVEVNRAETGDRVVLDRTAFYPTGGGQPNDTGRLGDSEVIDVFEEGRIIYHVVKGASPLVAGQAVSGRVDAARRLDHLQQHSGQHILSQAFIQACGAHTRSFHLGPRTSTIDIDLQSPTDDHMRAAEEIANRVIFDNRAMRVHLLSEEAAAKVPLRKESAAHGTVRVIEVEGFDWSPCGGTHASGAGRVGLIAIKSYERAKKMTRVEFVCGRRALEDYRAANKAAVTVAQMFSAERDAAPEMVSKALVENKALKRRLRDLLELAMAAEASQLLSAAARSGEVKVVEAIFEGRELEEIRLLATKIVEREAAVALLGTRDRQTARLVFARSESLAHDMGRLMAESCSLLGGRGGGKPELAQGGGPAADKLDDAINLAARRVKQSS